MKQQVNFFIDEFKPKSDPLSIERMLTYWGVAVILLCALYPLESEKKQLAERNLVMAEQQEERISRQLNNLQRSFSERGDASYLEQLLLEKNASLEQRQQVLLQLGLRSDGMEKGVSGILDDLGKAPIDGLWLSTIGIYQGQLNVTGLTTNADNVPTLVNKLQALDSLKDKRFSRLVIKQAEIEGLLEFSLQSENAAGNATQTRGMR